MRTITTITMISKFNSEIDIAKFREVAKSAGVANTGSSAACNTAAFDSR